MQFTNITSTRTPAHEDREIVLPDLDAVVAAMRLLGQLRNQDRSEVTALAERMVTEITSGTGYSPYAARITGADDIMKNLGVPAPSCTGRFFTHNELSSWPPFEGLTVRVHPNGDGFVFRVAEHDSSRVFVTAAELADALGDPWPIRAVTPRVPRAAHRDPIRASLLTRICSPWPTGCSRSSGSHCTRSAAASPATARYATS